MEIFERWLWRVLILLTIGFCASTFKSTYQSAHRYQISGNGVDGAGNGSGYMVDQWTGESWFFQSNSKYFVKTGNSQYLKSYP